MSDKEGFIVSYRVWFYKKKTSCSVFSNVFQREPLVFDLLNFYCKSSLRLEYKCKLLRTIFIIFLLSKILDKLFAISYLSTMDD